MNTGVGQIISPLAPNSKGKCGLRSSISPGQRSFAIRLDVAKPDVAKLDVAKNDVVKNDTAPASASKGNEVAMRLLADIEMAL